MKNIFINRDILILALIEMLIISASAGYFYL